jgi:hypothetical protein
MSPHTFFEEFPPLLDIAQIVLVSGHLALLIRVRKLLNSLNIARVKTGDVFKACALIIKDSNLICETGTNYPALRPEFKDLYLQQQQDEGSATASSQAARVSEVSNHFLDCSL